MLLCNMQIIKEEELTDWPLGGVEFNWGEIETGGQWFAAISIMDLWITSINIYKEEIISIRFI